MKNKMYFKTLNKIKTNTFEAGEMHNQYLLPQQLCIVHMKVMA